MSCVCLGGKSEQINELLKNVLRDLLTSWGQFPFWGLLIYACSFITYISIEVRVWTRVSLHDYIIVCDNTEILPSHKDHNILGLSVFRIGSENPHMEEVRGSLLVMIHSWSLQILFLSRRSTYPARAVSNNVMEILFSRRVLVVYSNFLQGICKITITIQRYIFSSSWAK